MIELPDLVPRHAESLVTRLLDDRFVVGYVLYTGQPTLPFGEKVGAVPMDALWCLAP